jgi:hypothetical protein
MLISFQYNLPENKSRVIISKQQLTPQGSTTPLELRYYAFTNDLQKALIFLVILPKTILSGWSLFLLLTICLFSS